MASPVRRARAACGRSSAVRVGRWGRRSKSRRQSMTGPWDLGVGVHSVLTHGNPQENAPPAQSSKLLRLQEPFGFLTYNRRQPGHSLRAVGLPARSATSPRSSGSRRSSRAAQRAGRRVHHHDRPGAGGGRAKDPVRHGPGGDPRDSPRTTRTRTCRSGWSTGFCRLRSSMGCGCHSRARPRFALRSVAISDGRKHSCIAIRHIRVLSQATTVKPCWQFSKFSPSRVRRHS